jgi:hypothetical protein
MHKYIICTLLVSYLSMPAHAQTLTKKDKKQVISELKGYKKHPEAYKRMIDTYKQTIDSSATDISQKKEIIKQLTVSNGNLIKQVADLQSQLAACQSKPAPKCPDCPAPGAIPNDGTAYKVQIGFFKNFDMSRYFAEPKYVGIEKADGNKNRYVISYFTDKKEAERCVSDLKRLGVRGAFVAKYENGQRAMAQKPAAKAKKAKK